MYKILFLVTILFFIGCEEKSHPNLDGKKLLEQKCSKCHNLELPPKTFADEKAPPMMAVSFHVHDFIHATNESDKISKAIDFVKDYVIHPSVSKSFCDKKSLEDYGVMPSQKGKVSQDELQVIGEYMFSHYTIKNLTDEQAREERLAKMPKGKRLAMHYNCLACHCIDKKIVGPSFQTIVKRYNGDILPIIQGIKNGSSKKYKNSLGARMPAFGEKLSDKEIDTIAQWIVKAGSTLPKAQK